MQKSHGYGSSLPPGACVLHDGQLVNVFAQMNDVRFSSVNQSTGMATANGAGAMGAHALAALRASEPAYE
eukprot:6803381-Prymnesium_polylepis.1